MHQILNFSRGTRDRQNSYRSNQRSACSLRCVGLKYPWRREGGNYRNIASHLLVSFDTFYNYMALCILCWIKDVALPHLSSVSHSIHIYICTISFSFSFSFVISVCHSHSYLHQFHFIKHFAASRCICFLAYFLNMYKFIWCIIQYGAGSWHPALHFNNTVEITRVENITECVNRELSLQTNVVILWDYLMLNLNR